MTQFFDEFLAPKPQVKKQPPIKAANKPINEAPNVTEQLYQSNREKEIKEEDAYAIKEEVAQENELAKYIVFGGALNSPRFKRRSWHR